MDQKQNNLSALLALIVTVGFLSILGYLAVSKTENKDLLNVMIGSLGGGWVSIVSYYFGSSRGSDEKTSLIAAAQNQKKEEK